MSRIGRKRYATVLALVTAVGAVAAVWATQAGSRSSVVYTPQATISCVIQRNVVKLRVTDFGKGGVITDTIDRNVDVKGRYVRHVVNFSVDGLHVDLTFGRPIKRPGLHGPSMYSASNVDVLWYVGSAASPTPRNPSRTTRRKVDGCLR
jgi:hypothetical protein